MDYDILFDVLQRRFIVHGPAFEWFRSCLTGGIQVFCVGGKQFATFPVSCSVPQGSVLGQVQFISYNEDITIVFDKHGIKRHHLFADDKVLLTSLPVADVSAAKSNTEACFSDVQAWCASRSTRLRRKLSGLELAIVFSM